MNRIDVDGARRLIDEGSRVVDVLPSSVYVQEHLPGAVNMPLETLDHMAVADWDRDQRLVVYCFDQH